MAFFVADQNQVAFRHESGTYGTESGPLFWVGMIQSHTVDESQGIINERYVGAGDRNIQQYVDGARTYNGTLTYWPQDWTFLKFALGSNVDSGSPSPYIHTIVEVDSDNVDAHNAGNFASFTIEDAQQTLVGASGANVVRTIKGGTVNTFELSATQGEPITVTIGYTGQDVTYTSGAAAAVTAATTDPYEWQHMKVFIPSGAANQLSEVTDATITVNNNLDIPNYVGTRVIAQPIPTNRDYTIDLTVQATDTWSKKFYSTYWDTGTEFNLFVQIQRSTGSAELFWTFSGCKVTSFNTPTNNEGVNTYEVSVSAKTSDAVVNDLIFRYNLW